MRKVTTILVLFGSLLVPAAATATTQTVSSGDVTATFSFTGKPPLVKHERLEISQSGSVVYDQPVNLPGCSPYCGPGAVKGNSVHVLDLDGTGQLDVVLELFSGGAHCCFYDQVFSPGAPTGSWVVATRDFENSGAALEDLNHNGRTEFLTADNAFAYTFTDFAESGLPIQVLSFSGGAFHNITRSYPSLIRKDAAVWWKAYLSDHDSGRVGLIAAWAADEYNLRKAGSARRTLARQVSKHHITAHFVKRLETFLKSHGY